MYWTEQKILSVTPDAVTLERARALTARRNWEHTYSNGQVIWGICKSSGEALYDVAAAADREHYYCSCPARKRPCKHILALLLRHQEATAAFRFTRDIPVWIAELRPASQGQLPPVPVAEPVSDRRLEEMAAGVEELEQWLLDLIRQGMAAAQAQGEDFWEAAAARMVDAKLRGVGRRIRSWPAFFAKAEWPSFLLAEIAELFLFVQAFRRREALPASLQFDLLNLAGVNFKKDEVLRQEGVPDRWLILGKVEGAEEKLSFRRTWLWGEKSRRAALLLDFAWGGQGFELDWLPGAVIEGALVFYPSAYPLRALVGRFVYSREAFTGLDGYENLDSFLKDYAQALAVNPWLRNFPCLLDRVVPLWQEGRGVLVDRRQQYLPLTGSREVIWKLIALGGGHPLLVFGEWDGRQLTPLTAFADKRMVLL